MKPKIAFPINLNDVLALQKQKPKAMNTHHFPQNLDEITFENRNKEYGAYQLRKTYGRRTLFSILLATSLVTAFLLILIPHNEAKPEIDPIITTSTMMSLKIQPVKIKENNKVKKQTAAQKEKHGRSNASVEIVNQANASPKALPKGGGNGNDDDEEYFGFPTLPTFSVDTTTTKTNRPRPITTFASIMPKYPGGDEALLEFIYENVYFPERLKQLGVEGTVYVSFVVETNGSISQIGIERGVEGGKEFEKIAVNAIRKMPNWEPGRNGNTKVAVKQTLPIQFSLVNN